MAKEKFPGMAYPITKHPFGFFHTSYGNNQIKSDLLILLMTYPGERVMLPEFGTPLRDVLFEPNDDSTADIVREMIIESIRTWEPRVTIKSIDITIGLDEESRNASEMDSNLEYIMHIKILFHDFESITDVQELKLDLPLSTR